MMRKTRANFTSEMIHTQKKCLLYRIAQVAQILMLLSIYLSYALQFYVPFEIIQPIVRNYIPTTTFDYRGIGDVVLRIALVLFTCLFKYKFYVC